MYKTIDGKLKEALCDDYYRGSGYTLLTKYACLRTNVKAYQSHLFVFRYFIEKRPEANSVAITVERLLLARPSVHPRSKMAAHACPRLTSSWMLLRQRRSSLSGSIWGHVACENEAFAPRKLIYFLFHKCSVIILIECNSNVLNVSLDE